jgi:(1->4)-alpha-D-glucan 1-alpha-D-glucosylmutase
MAQGLPEALAMATATYRIQLRNGVTFAVVEDWLPHLADLGISHLYLSPIFTAQSGSTHGYDVTRPDQIDPSLGGDEGFERLAHSAHAHGLSVVIDIVPNHTALSFENLWLRDALRYGPDSRFARHFDIDWAERMRLTMLGASFETVISHEEARLADDPDGPVLHLAGLSVPLNPDTCEGLTRGVLDIATLRSLHDKQHWQLVHWEMERDHLSHRRFFNVTSLIGMRIEDSQVFEDMHALTFALIDQGLVQALRVDHVDGLADPGAYIDQLAARLPGTPVWVEKILTGDEGLDTDWPVVGTTGYEAGRAIAAVLSQPEGVARLKMAWGETTGDRGDFHSALRTAKQEVIRLELSAELAQLVALARALVAELPHLETGSETLREVLIALLIEMPRYRTYFTDAPPRPEDLALWQDVVDRAATQLRSDRVLRILGTEIMSGTSGPAQNLRVRFQQVTGALLAKAHEDTAGFRYMPYLAANEVGADPDAPAISTQAFAAFCQDRLQHWPGALTLTSSHDTKRSEDARMRLVATSHDPEAFLALLSVITLRPDAAGIAPATLWLLAQSALAIWRAADDPQGGDLGPRLAEHLRKALREAKQVTFWPYPNAAIEDPVCALAEALMREWQGAPPAALLRLCALGEALSLCQLALKCTMPGLPDIYRGTEGAALDLTDPDNRRPIDLHHLSTLPAQSGFDGQKSRLLTQLLAARKAAPSLFLSGDFEIDASAKGITLRRNSTDGASLQLTLNPELPCENAVTLHFHMPD